MIDASITYSILLTLRFNWIDAVTMQCLRDQI